MKSPSAEQVLQNTFDHLEKVLYEQRKKESEELRTVEKDPATTLQGEEKEQDYQTADE